MKSEGTETPHLSENRPEDARWRDATEHGIGGIANWLAGGGPPGSVPGDLEWEGLGAMKKGGILNPAICSLLAELGHTDELLIVDAAYPLPTEGHVIDLTLTPGIPRLLDVVRAVAEELVIESIAVPAEIKDYSPRLYQEIVKILGDIDVDEVPFHEFKEHSLDVKGIIRTAEFSPYANVRIVAGSAF